MNNNASDTLTRTGSYERPGSPDQEVHQPWCDPAQHAQATAELPDRHPGCVGRLHEATTPDGLDVGGWWTQHRGEGPRFHVDYPTTNRPEGWDLPIEGLRAFGSLLLELGATPQIARVSTALHTAIADFEEGIPASA